MLTRKKKIKKKYKIKTEYKKKKCSFVDSDGKRCKRNAVGKSSLCQKHGGLKYDPDLALSVSETKEVLGRTKFNPSVHPIKFIEYSAEGLSPVEIAAKFLVGRNTLEGWAERYIEFLTAFDVGKVLYESWWLAKGKDGLEKRGFNTPLYKFLTGNKLGYSDKSESRNLNINQNLHGVLVVPEKQTEDEWSKGVIDV